MLTPDQLMRLSGLELQARAIVEGAMSGQHRSPARGVSVEFAEHRQYAAGDDLRHVDWKVFGRRDRFYVRQYEMESDLICHLLVDTTESMSYQSEKSSVTKLEYARWLAAATGFVITQQQDLISLSSIDQSLRMLVPPGGRMAHWHNVVPELEKLEALASQKGDQSETPFQTALEQFAEQSQRRAVVVVISDCLRPMEEIVSGMRALRSRKHDVLLLHLLDPAELEFPFEGPVLFQGLEALGEQLVETRSLQAAYQAEARIFCESLERECRDIHADYSRVLTTEPVDLALRSTLLERSRGG
ncbi:MAG: DUF58 domain-containing protein [Planctomycetota bacterium]|nr:MAG: DUF58 domain-containing protein [Planctomycetota bacterium]